MKKNKNLVFISLFLLIAVGLGIGIPLGIILHNEEKINPNDTIPPNVLILSPSNSVYNDKRQLLNITATDMNSEIDRIWYNWDGTNETYLNLKNITFNEGANTIKAWANDTMGNIDSDSTNFVIDTTAPNITINNPENKTYLEAQQRLSISATDMTSEIDTIWYNWKGINETYTDVKDITFDEGLNTLRVWANDTAGNTDFKSVRFTVASSITINGLNLKDNQNKTYEQCKLVIQGVINITGNAKLTISDCLIYYNQTYHQQYWLYVHDNGILNVNNCELKTKDMWWVNWEFYNNATVYETNFQRGILWQATKDSAKIYADNTNIGITIMSDKWGSVLVENSKDVWFELGLEPGDYYFELPSGYVDHWSPPGMKGNIEVNQSTINQINIDISPNVNVTVNNTEILSFGWVMGTWGSTENITISGLNKSYYADAEFYGDDNSYLRIINSTVNKWWPTTFGNVNLTLINCQFADPRAWEDSIMTMINCKVDLFAAYDTANASIYNSTIFGDIAAFDDAEIRLYNIKHFGSYTTDENGVIYRDDIQVAP